MISGHTLLRIVFACLVYAATLLVTTPAPWVSRTIERASNQGLVLRDPAGTAWSGSGILYARLRSGELFDLGRLRWNSSASGIFAGFLAADLALGADAKAARVELSPSSMNVRDLSLDLPGRILAQLAPALGALGPEGKLRLRAENLRVEAGSMLGQGAVEWREIRLARAGGIDFGSHVARLRGGGGGKIEVELGTIEGPLRLSGGGTWTAESGLNVSGTLEHDEERSASMTQFLKGVCSEYRSGRCTFRFRQ